MKRKDLVRLTVKNKRGIPTLKNPLQIEKAINILYEYENTKLTPQQINELQDTIYNLNERIKGFEQWQ